MSISDVEHFATVLSGCESINHGDYKAPDSTYAQTVLKLHAQDAGFIAGQEGFLDSIKKGASNVKEWILKLIRALIGFFNKGGSPREERKDYEKLEKEFAKNAPEMHKKIIREVYGDAFSKIQADVISALDSDKAELMVTEYRIFENFDNIPKSLDKPIEQVKEGKYPSNSLSFFLTSSDFKRYLEKIEKKIRSLGKDEPVPEELTWFVKFSKLIVESQERINGLDKLYARKYDEYLKAHFPGDSVV